MNLLRGWLFGNLGLKLTALLLAVLVYLNVYTDRPATMVLSFPLEFSDLPDSLSLSGPAPAVVQTELRGTGKQLIMLRVREPRLRIPMTGATPGHFSRALVASDLPLPAGGSITVENLIGPRVIEVDVDRRMQRDVPVSVKVEGTPAAGYAWSGELALLPAMVRVTGPRAAVRALDTLRLAPVRLDGRRDSVRVDLAPASMPDWCTAEPANVRVRLLLAHR
jgi:YbbR domain-containing protein